MIQNYYHTYLNDQKNLNEKLVKVDTWFKCNTLSLNISERNVIVFHSNINQNNVEHVIIESEVQIPGGSD